MKKIYNKIDDKVYSRVIRNNIPLIKDKDNFIEKYINENIWLSLYTMNNLLYGVRW